MPSKLRHSSARVSFFAFHDMITTVTGVLMIVMLLLSLEVGQRVASADASPSHTAREELNQASKQLAANLEALRQRQAELMALSNRVFVVREEDRSGRQPILVALSATRGSCSRLGQTNLVEFLVSTSNPEFQKLLPQWNPRTERLVFYVRPSGVAAFDSCRKLATERGFIVGYDAAEEEKEYILTSR